MYLKDKNSKIGITGIILIVCAFVVYISANAQSNGVLQNVGSAKLKIAVPFINIPESFRGMGENIIHDPGNTLNPFFSKLGATRKSYLENNILEKNYLLPQPSDSMYVIHIGDSHIRGHVYPRTVRDMLTESFGSIDYRDFGINGATCNSYLGSSKMREICTYTLEQEPNPLAISDAGNPLKDQSVGIIAKHHKPNLIIVSFGTNESYGKYYNADEHYQQIDALVKALNEAFPGTPLLLTTPAGCYKAHRTSYKVKVPIGGRHSRSRRYKMVTRTRTTYSENPFNAPCAETIVKYAKDNNIAYWDLYSVSGGRENACRNWTAARLMRPDHVHFLPDGYVLQGQLLYCALIKEYNK